MSWDDDYTSPDGIFHHVDFPATRNISVSLSPTSEDLSPSGRGDCRLMLNFDSHEHEWSTDPNTEERKYQLQEPVRMARLAMNSDSARRLARQLSKAAREVDDANGMSTGSRSEFEKFLDSLESAGTDSPLYLVEYDADEPEPQRYRWGMYKPQY